MLVLYNNIHTTNRQIPTVYEIYKKKKRPQSYAPFGGPLLWVGSQDIQENLIYTRKQQVNAFLTENDKKFHKNVLILD